MPSPVGSILRASSKKEGKPLNILTAPCHESWESNLCKTGHNFYAFRSAAVKDWNTTFRPVPDNYTLLNPNKGEQQLPQEIEFDVILSHQKFGMFQILSQYAKMLHLPLISLEHTLPHPSWNSDVLQQLKNMRGDINVFISEFSQEKWGWKPTEAIVVRHGLDVEQFCPNPMMAEKKNHILSVVNQFNNPQRFWCCGYEMWEEVTKGLPRVHVGHSLDGWSQPAKSVADLVRYYRECTVFVDTATASPIPSVLLEAMSCGAVCVSHGNALVPEVIQHEVNGFIEPTTEGMRARLKAVLANPSAYSEIGKRARQTIIDKFSLNKFVENWNRVFKTASEITFLG